MKMNEELKELQAFTIEEFQKDFDTLMDRVENGESFVIKSEHGNAVMIPYNRIIDILEDFSMGDELIRIYTNHEEGC
jgi:hypothetical protein